MFEPVEITGPTGRFSCQVGGPENGEVVLAFHDEVRVSPNPLVEHLAETRRVVAPVLPGFGAADRPDWVESMTDLVDHLGELTDAIEPDPVTVVGASLGGWVAAEVALRLLPRAMRLVLVAPAGLGVPGHPAADHWFAEPEERAAMLYADPAAAPEVELDEYLANEESAARYAWSPRFYSETLEHRLPRLACPVLVVWGQQDGFLGSAHAKAWASALPDAQVEQLDGCGHFPAYERPDALIEVVDAWLR